MIPSCYFVFTLLVDLGEATGKQVESVAGFISTAHMLTVVSWCAYPAVYAVKSMDLSGTTTKRRDDFLLLPIIIIISHHHLIATTTLHLLLSPLYACMCVCV